jgi:SAM-dependent methyltransferase
MSQQRSPSRNERARTCDGAIAVKGSPYERLSLEDDYERPAIRAAAGDVRGLDVLDVGSAGDEHALWLVEHGARILEIDPGVHDLREPLPLQKESVDLVFSSLTLHQVREWEPILREFRRVTRPGGSLVFSTHHPCRGLHDGLGVDYFSTGLVVEEHVRYWRRPLQSIVNAIIETDWRVVKITEPRIAEAVDPWFIVVKASR